MKNNRKIQLLVLLTLFSATCFAQWNTTGDNSTTGNLTVGGVVNITGNQLRFSESRGLDYEPTLDAMFFNGYNNGRVVKLGDSNGNGWFLGNLGVGTSTPSNPLQIEGTGTELNLLVWNKVSNGAKTYLASFAGKSSIQTDKDFTIRTYNGTWTDKFTVSNSGNVGIGTSPVTKLDLGILRFDAIASFPAEGAVLEGVWGNYIIGSLTNGQQLRLGVANDSYTRAEVFIDNSNRADGTISLKTANGTGGAQTRLFVQGSGNIGIGTDVPAEKLHVNGTLGIGKLPTSQHSGLKIEYIEDGQGGGTSVFTHQRWGGNFHFKRNDAAGTRSQLFFGGSGNHYMDIYNDNNEVKVKFNTAGNSYFNGGNVGIGCTNPDSKLTVKGLIHTEEVKVELLNSICPDYVFESDYDLSPLSEIESYIKENKHLPEVPSAKEMEAEGLNLKEMNLLLLKKVEELTLHLIQKEKELQSMNDGMSSLLKRIEKLESVDK